MCRATLLDFCQVLKWFICKLIECTHHCMSYCYGQLIHIENKRSHRLAQMRCVAICLVFCKWNDVNSFQALAASLLHDSFCQIEDQ